MKKWITFGEIYLTIQTNAFLYYLRKLPVVKYLVSSEWYSRYGWKRLFSIFGVIVGFLKDAIGENIGVLFWVYLLPSLIAPDFNMGSVDYFLLFLGVKCVVSIIDGSPIFNSHSDDYTFLYHFMVNPKIYYLYKALRETFFSSVMLLPVLAFLLKDFFLVLAAVSLKMMCELLGNVGYLLYYYQKKRLPKIRIRQLTTAIITVLAYVPLFVRYTPDVVFSRSALIVITIGAIIVSCICWRFHNRFEGYKEIAVTFGDQSMVSFHVAVRSVGEDERGLVERPWEENKMFFEAFKNLTPVEYLHNAFWDRFGKIIRKDNRAQAVVSCCLLTILGLCIRFGWIPLKAEELLEYSPILVSLSMSFSTANKMTQMYFRNIDLHLLYHHMSTEKYIRESMTKRYLQILRSDFIYTCVTLVGILAFLLAAGFRLPVKTIIQLLLVSGAFLVMWDTYELMLYYFIQPYTVDLTAKSPLFSFLHVVEGLFGVLILFVRNDLTLALPMILTIMFIIVCICFVSSRYAYKFFKLRF